MMAVVAVPTGPAAVAAEPPTVTFTGAGWGHAVGLSQYGAYGASRDGWTKEQILSHFYQGTSVEKLGEGGLTVPDDIWVGLDRDLESVTLIARKVYYTEPPGPMATVVVTRGSDTWELAENDRIGINRVPGTRTCELVFSGSFSETVGAGPCDLEITWDGDAEQPTRKIEVDGCEFIDWNGLESEYPPGGASLYRPCQYGRGYMAIRAPGDGSIGPFDMTMVMDIEDYLLGISEMPYWWGHPQAGGMAALEAQAIAARSYARELQLYRGTPGNNSCGASCHVRDDTYDQRYVGWGHGWSTWTAAVTNTAGLVMTHPEATTSPVAANDTENIVRGYYSSSSGGATENGHEVSVGGSVPKEYYTSADDHWSLDPSLNFRASWTFDFDAGYVAGKVGLDTIKSVSVTARNTSTSAKTVRFTGTSGGAPVTVDKASSWVKTTFGLYSIYFDVAHGEVAPFTDIAGSVHYDSIVFIADAGITAGCNPPANTNYCPAGTVTRGQMAAFLVRALALTDDGGKDWFGDDNGSTFEADINKLAASGITFGCNDAQTAYCPGANVTRAQMAAFLVRAFGYTDAGAGNWFVDDDQSVFETEIDRLRVAGVTLGCNPPENTKFCPDDPVRRDQMASFLARALAGS